FDLGAQVLEHFDRVLNRVAVRELVRLAKDVAVLVEENRFGGGGTAVDADETADNLIRVEHCGNESLAAIGDFEVVEVLIAGGKALRPRLGLFFLAAVV